jgi:hypothetical protein
MFMVKVEVYEKKGSKSTKKFGQKTMLLEEELFLWLMMIQM